MANSIGSLYVDLSVNSAAFAADMGKAQRALASESAKMNRHLSSIDRGVGGVVKSLGRFATVAGVVAGVAGLGRMTQHALESADAIGKAADAVGIGTDALQEYRHAANLAGVQTDAMDGALKAFTKRMGEARANTGTLVTFLEKYDKALLQTIQNAPNTEAALDAIFNGMAKAGTAADRAALASAAFGRTAGVDMANLVRDGADSLKEAREEAHRLGIVLDEDLIRNSEKANDAVERLTAVLGANTTRVLADLAPTIEGVSTFMANSIPVVIDLAEKYWRLIPILGQTARAYETLFGPIGETAGQKLARQIAETTARIAELKAGIEEAKASGTDQMPGFFLAEDELERATAKLKELIELQKKLANLAKKPPGGGGEDDARLEARKKSIGELMDSLSREIYAIETKTNLLGAMAGAQERADAQLRISNALTDKHINLTRQENSALVDYLDDLEKAYQRRAEAEKAMRAMEAAAEESKRRFEDMGRSAADALRDITTGAASARDAVLRLVASLAQAYLQAKLFGPLGNALGGLIGGIGGSAYAGGPTPPTLIHAAHGADFTVGGRSGTDANFIPLKATRGERVTVQTPQQQRQSQGGNTFIVDMRGASAEAVQRLEGMVARMDATLERRAISAVGGAARRGAL